MKIIRNNFIPFPGFKAINLFGILFVRGNATISQEVINHESIHTAQMKEMLTYRSICGTALNTFIVCSGMRKIE